MIEDKAPTPLISDRTVFSSYLDNSGAEPVAMGAFFIAPIAFLLIGPNIPGFAALFVIIGVGLYHLPALFKKRPQIVMDRHGILLDGLGTLPWNCVDKAIVQETWLRSMKFERISLHLNGPANERVVAQSSRLPFHSFLFKVWTHPTPDLIVIKAELLSDKPGIISQAINAFVERSNK